MWARPLNRSTFTRPDRLPGRALRACTDQLANVFTDIFNLSLTESVIPTCFKQNLDPYKSAGLDNLDPLFLKLSSKIVATPITRLFNLSFVLSEIPKDWKAAAVIPLFKEGDTLDPHYYIPISILPCLSKVFESQVNKQITDHFQSLCTFSTMQSGFRAGHGCSSATLPVLNDI